MHKDLKQNQLNKAVNVAQKVAIFAVFFSMIGMLVYSLIFMTPFYEIYKLQAAFLIKNMPTDMAEQYKSMYGSIKDGAILPCTYNPVTGKLNGINLKYFTEYTRENGLQVYNHWLFNFGLIGLLVSLVPFIFASQKRKRYYAANYIANGASAGLNLYVGFSLLINGLKWKEYVSQQDFKIISAYQSYINEDAEIVDYYTFDGVKWVFDLGTVIAIVIIAIAVICIGVTIWKFFNQRKMPKIDFSEVKINE